MDQSVVYVLPLQSTLAGQLSASKTPEKSLSADDFVSVSDSDLDEPAALLSSEDLIKILFSKQSTVLLQQNAPNIKSTLLQRSLPNDM